MSVRQRPNSDTFDLDASRRQFAISKRNNEPLGTRDLTLCFGFQRPLGQSANFLDTVSTRSPRSSAHDHNGHYRKYRNPTHDCPSQFHSWPTSKHTRP